ncbi:hypothetical protein [Virgibacillus proomii]|uniref:hypothetical protein n=1 Tax=Virgibacillus proomii TaxID=84407 RepID=UPI001C103A2D|nr:hypothetical protein [Virgibacillus proomii]MBU5266284.1 hypothetical protein [Virgibacillus proomii]
MTNRMQISSAIRPVLNGIILQDTTDLVIDGNKALIMLVPSENNISLLDDVIRSAWNVQFDVAIGSTDKCEGVVNLRVYDRCNVRINKASGGMDEYTAIELLVEEVKEGE